MLARILVPNFSKIAFHRSDMNLGSRSEIIANGSPQSAICSLSNTATAHSSADQVDFPGINAILFENLHVIVNRHS